MVLLDKLIDFRNQLFDTLKGSSPNGPLCNQVEPDLHLIEPRSIGGCIVNLVTGMSCQPALDLGMLMGGIVINHQMDI